MGLMLAGGARAVEIKIVEVKELLAEHPERGEFSCAGRG